MIELSYEARVTLGVILRCYDQGVFSERTWVQLVPCAASPAASQQQWRGYNERKLPTQAQQLDFMTAETYEELKAAGVFVQVRNRARVNLHGRVDERNRVAPAAPVYIEVQPQYGSSGRDLPQPEWRSG